MDDLSAIILFGLLMSAIALVGSVTLIMPEETLKKLILPFVALASGCQLQFDNQARGSFCTQRNLQVCGEH